MTLHVLRRRVNERALELQRWVAEEAESALARNPRMSTHRAKREATQLVKLKYGKAWEHHQALREQYDAAVEKSESAKRLRRN